MVFAIALFGIVRKKAAVTTKTKTCAALANRWLCYRRRLFFLTCLVPSVSLFNNSCSLLTTFFARLSNCSDNRPASSPFVWPTHVSGFVSVLLRHLSSPAFLLLSSSTGEEDTKHLVKIMAADGSQSNLLSTGAVDEHDATGSTTHKGLTSAGKSNCDDPTGGIDSICSQNHSNEDRRVNGDLMIAATDTASRHFISSGSSVPGFRSYRSGLRVNNSMCANEKEEFIAQSPCGRKVAWYGCGPTVYDAPHMGHARSYVTFDILRRIMEGFFGYEVNLVMNVTDIDDKIIQRAAEQNIDFRQLASHWESVFWRDMKDLNVQLPDCVTRVSEYIPEIVDFIREIVDRHYAYESNGSVYFDTKAFRESGKHVYGRMEPGAVNDQNRVLEGEGALGMTSASDKKCVLDFALWKRAKQGEPSWESPWGQGRPGWHIECSAMANSILPFPLDIHSGGIDLRFPHHTNELAQSEARFDMPKWVNYFLHTGHLHIQGAKMSKSLKNFITIGEALSSYNARHIRLLCLMSRWDSPMNYSAGGETMQQAVEVDRLFVSFFGLVRDTLRNSEVLLSSNAASEIGTCRVGAAQKWETQEIRLATKLGETQLKVREFLSDNFNTPDALVALQRLVSEVHSYINNTSPEHVRAPIIRKAATYAFKMVKIFGLTNNGEDGLQYEADVAEEVDVENAISPVMQILGSFRGTIRSLSQSLVKDLKEGTAGRESALELLRQCDVVRNEQLPRVGVLLEDKASGFVWKRVAKQDLEKAAARKAEEEQLRKEKQAENKRIEAEKAARKAAEAQIPPSDYFRVTRGSEFKEFGADGVPTLTADGQTVSKAATEKMRKALEKHRKVYDAWLATRDNISS